MTDYSHHQPLSSTAQGDRGSVCIKGQKLTVSQVQSVACNHRNVKVTEDPNVLGQMQFSENMVRDAVDAGEKIYGITTGYGGMAEMKVSREHAGVSQINLLSFLSAGAGKPIADEHVRAAMFLRANMLLKGASGVRLDIVERLVQFLNEGFTPVVGELGSIGASGDLIPLGTIARAISGQSASCKVSIKDGEEVIDRDEALNRLGLKPLRLLPKEALAIVNGTTFSTAIAANNLHAGKNLLCLALASNAMMVKSLLGHESPYSDFVHKCKPHPGQIWTAKLMQNLLGFDKPAKDAPPAGQHLQDRYSVRCLPQYLGPIVESFKKIEKTIETEMNSITDNPLIDEEGCFFQSGNFLGQYVGVAMDDLRRQLGYIAKHLDVQIALLVSPEFNHGLPASLTSQGNSPIDLNLKGLQITGNSIMPQLMHLANPIVDHFPTHAEQYNQNINGLSWGAANLASQSIELSTYYSAVSLIFAVQSADLRSANLNDGDHDGRRILSDKLHPIYEAVYRIAQQPLHSEAPLINNDLDASLEVIIERLSESISSEGALVKAVSSIADSLNEVEMNI